MSQPRIQQDGDMLLVEISNSMYRFQTSGTTREGERERERERQRDKG
jgi:hypothetical protein